MLNLRCFCFDWRRNHSATLQSPTTVLAVSYQRPCYVLAEINLNFNLDLNQFQLSPQFSSPLLAQRHKAAACGRPAGRRWQRSRAEVRGKMEEVRCQLNRKLHLFLRHNQPRIFQLSVFPGYQLSLIRREKSSQVSNHLSDGQQEYGR